MAGIVAIAVMLVHDNRYGRGTWQESGDADSDDDVDAGVGGSRSGRARGCDAMNATRSRYIL